MAAAGETVDRHFSGTRRLDAGDAVLDDEAARRRHAHSTRGTEKEIRRRLAAAHLGRAEDVWREAIEQPNEREAMPQPVGRAARRDARPARQPVQRGCDAGHGGKLGVECRGEPQSQGLGETGRHCPSAAPLEIGEHRSRAQADIAVEDVVDRDRDADLGETRGVDAAGDELAVDQNAVAIEDDEIRDHGAEICRQSPAVQNQLLRQIATGRATGSGRLGGTDGIGHSDVMQRNPDIATLRDVIARARRVVVFTGAGISTESGIPDFRSPGGIWTRQQPIEFGDFVASEEARREAWRRRFESDEVWRTARPNRGHRAVAALIAAGKASRIITQNIDGLHQQSGIAEDRIIELHGNATYAHCLDCGARYEIEDLRVGFERDAMPPRCRPCGGLVKTATISFGQAMPQEAMRQAQEETLAADLFIAAGSSLVVYPAAGFPGLAKRNGAVLVIVNREKTSLDPIADLVLNQAIGETLGEAVGVD